MLINFNTLKKLPVETRTGYRLGKAKEIEIDGASLKIKKLLVFKEELLKVFGQPDYLIDAEQVIEINKEKIIVSDAAVKVLAEKDADLKFALKENPEMGNGITTFSKE